MPDGASMKNMLKDVDANLQVKILNEMIDRITKKEIYVAVETEISTHT